jgi:hypothetical protein
MLESPLVPLNELPKVWDPDEGRVMNAEELLDRKGAMVMSDRGSVRGKFRYFVVLGIDTAKPFSKETFRKALECDGFFKQAVEVERSEFKDTHIVLTILIAPMLAPLDYISDLLGRSKRADIALYRGFFIANSKKPSARDIAHYLADFKPS